MSKRTPLRKRLVPLLKEQIAPLALMVLLLTSFRSAIADWNIVPSGSMNPNIVEGDRIFVNKLAYGLKVPYTTWHLAHWSEPKRGEIVVFNSPVDGTRLVKRVVAVPGDVVALVNDRLFINNTPVVYSSLTPSFGMETLDQSTHPIMFLPRLPAMRDFGPVTVPAGSYFMMGDNRDNSADSRYFGFVPRDNVLGRSSSVLVSIDPNSHLPRLNRTLKSLP